MSAAAVLVEGYVIAPAPDVKTGPAEIEEIGLDIVDAK